MTNLAGVNAVRGELERLAIGPATDVNRFQDEPAFLNFLTACQLAIPTLGLEHRFGFNCNGLRQPGLAPLG